MNMLLLLIPVTLCLGALGLGAFFWCLRHGQYDDISGDAERILFQDEDAPLRRPAARTALMKTATETTP